MKKIKYVLPILIIVAVIGFAFTKSNSTVYASTMKKVNQISMKITNYLDELVAIKDEKMYLSSPIAIMKDNEGYANLVNLGIDAIKPLYEKLEKSNESGLMEYIYAMAIEDIMSQSFEYRASFDSSKTPTELENSINYWSNANEFKIAFSHFMEELPSKYEFIKNNEEFSEDIKEQKIIELGIGVIPYLVEDINSKNDSLKFNDILNNLFLEKNIKVDDSNKWIQSNQETIDMIKNITDK